MGGPGSGGKNKLSIEEHVRRNNIRPARHYGTGTPTVQEPLMRHTEQDRLEVTRGLKGEALRLATDLFERTKGDTFPAAARALMVQTIRLEAVRLSDRGTFAQLAMELERYFELRDELEDARR